MRLPSGLAHSRGSKPGEKPVFGIFPHSTERLLRRPSALLLAQIGFLSTALLAPSRVLPDDRETFEVGGRPAFTLEPPEAARRAGPTPWVWYAPTLEGRHPSGDEQWMFERLHAAGIAIAGVDVGESYGSPEGRRVYEALYEELTESRGYGRAPVLLARSRGGLMLYAWAVEHPESVGGIAGIYPVCSISSYPGIARAAPAYGLTPEALAAELDRHDPVDRLEELAACRVPILHLQGDSDRVVPHEENSGLLAERYRALGGPIEVELIAGQGHNMWRGWFESERLVDFMIAKALDWPDFELASPFVDGAVLQRGRPVPVWGWCRPGAAVSVTFDGRTKVATASARGEWSVELDALEASDVERELRVSSDERDIVVRRVLVGEVWFASGQSNMDWVAGKSSCRDLAARLARSEDEVPIRELNIDIGSSLFPRARTTSADGWKSSRRASEFSALSLAFAWRLREELGVPIGILRSTHGATPIETWTAYEGFAAHSELQHIALRVRESDPSTPEGRAAYASFYRALDAWRAASAEIMDRGGSPLPRPKLPGIADDWKGATRMFNRKIAPLIPYAIRGAIWCQGESNSQDGRIYAAKMEALVHGWRKAWRRPDLPFYFTQLQCYGEPDPNEAGFADLREAQTLFFRRAERVGMVAQHDLNPARPQGIHPHNKLDPGERLARWALAKEYGRDVAYVGPLYASHTVEGDAVRVRFEQRGPGGGLMVGSKGYEADAREDPGAYVEPARETPGEPLARFRLAGADEVWHDAEAVIEGDDEVVVRSEAVPEPVGVQYAYMNSPIGANLYSRAGLPAIPFAYFGDRQMFLEDDPAIVAAAAAEAERRYGKRTYLLPATLFRDGCVLQAALEVPVWGHGVPGTEVTVSFGEQVRRATVDEFERWRVSLAPMPASSRGRDLVIRSSIGEERIVRDVLVGDVWVLTGSRQLDGQLMRAPEKGSGGPEPLSLVREFRIKTKARRFRTPRKLRMEIGGGRYVASWQPADFDDVGDPPSVAAYHFAQRVRRPDVPVGIITLGAENPPITWASHEALQTAAGFEEERDDLNLAYPNTEVCERAVSQYVATMKTYNERVASLRRAGRRLPPHLADAAPAFPQPYYDEWVRRTETPTHTYNFCLSPLTPFAVRGVVWIPGEENISADVARYAPSLAVYAESLPGTFGQERVPFFFAQPAASLVEGISAPPRLPDGWSVDLEAWPKSLESVAARLGELAARTSLSLEAHHPVPESPSWLTFEGKPGRPGEGKHVVLVAADQEYRSEQSMPMLARILSERHGFHTTVLFSVNEKGEVDPTLPIRWQDDSITHRIPGLEHLATADLLILFSRLITLSDEQVAHVIRYLDAGKPVIGVRTANHGFLENFPYEVDGKRVRFGGDVLGGTFLSHHGRWHQDSTRGIVVEERKDHPILRGVEDVWGPSDVYRTFPEGESLPIECAALLYGQPLTGRKKDDPPNPEKEALPIAWTKTWTGSRGETARVFHVTMGSGKDYESAGLRRLTINAAYWCLGMEEQIRGDSSVDYVGEYRPLASGFDYDKLGVAPKPASELAPR